MYYRDSTVLKVKQLDLTGWVRNMKNSDVEILVEACGERERKIIEQSLIPWCWKGAEGAAEVGKLHSMLIIRFGK